MTASTIRTHLLPLLSPRSLELILLPTEQCNFRCTYCYEDFSIGRMKADTVAGVKRLIERRIGDLSTLHLSWFGGEPLVARDVVYDICDHAQRLADELPGVQYKSSITTNGSLLNPATAERLVRLGVKHYQISLDGLGTTHDVSRRRADHKGTFDVIWKNLLAMQQSSLEFDVLIRVHLQPHSVENVRSLTAELVRHFAADPRFDVFYKPVGKWGGPNHSQIEVLTEQDSDRVIGELEAEWRAARPHLPPAESTGAPYVCYASRPNSLMIRADGRIGKCTVMMRDARNDIGALQPDGTIALHEGRLAPWIRGFRSMDEDALGCPATNLPKLDLSKSSEALLQIQ